MEADGNGEGTEGLLGALLRRSHTLPPDELAAAVALESRAAGAVGVVIYLADYEQAYLVPLAGRGVPAREPLEIEATLAGRAFRLVETFGTAADDGQRLWVPMLDGTERVGVLEVLLPAAGDPALADVTGLAGLVAQLVVTKDHYGDVFQLARRRRPMSLAAEIQWELLPPLTCSTPELVLSGMLEPCYDIGGDTFDYALSGDVAHLAIIDAMGHGLPATLLSGLAVGSYRHSRRHRLDLVETYAAMDQAVAQQFGPERFVTAQLCRVERSTGRLRWVNAGHPAPLLVRGGRVVRVLTCAPSLPVGFGGAVTEIAEEALEPGDRLLFFTDGVVEARSPAGEFFGDQRLEELLTKAVAAGLPAPETVRRLTRELLAHQGGRLQDDATMLLLQWDGSDADPARTGGA